MGEVDSTPAAPSPVESTGQPEPAAQDVGLLLTGEGVPLLTDGHRALLAQTATAFAGGKAVELSVARDVEPVQQPKEAFDFTNMTPDEIVQVHRDILETEDDNAFDLINGLLDGFCWGLEELCTDSPDVAADVLEILATNTFDYEERETAACTLRRLAASNRQAAITLTETLLCDPDLNVREAAFISLEGAREARSFSLTETLHLLRVFNSVDNTKMAVEETAYRAEPDGSAASFERDR
jgi:hypothetical protein